MNPVVYRGVAGTVALLGLPMLGVWLAGYPMSRYLDFPPGYLYVDHAPYSRIAFVILAIIEVMAVMLAVRAGRRGPGNKVAKSLRSFPWWGWVGLISMAACWTLAWTRFEWFSTFQMHTFTPLWLTYIIVANAWTYRLSGRSLLTNDTTYLLKLFPLSAAFWWFFEYLNRFVQNWTYQGVGMFSPLEYFIFATLSFSTVLPAVLSTAELLRAWGLAHRADDREPRIPGHVARYILFAVSLAGLLFLGVLPNVLFPLLWLAPLGLLVFIQPLEHFSQVFPTVGTMLRLSAAALICGFFWEMWNDHSLAKWIYHVPGVERFHLFEMPILGFFGYLPFGWECAWLAAMVRRK